MRPQLLAVAAGIRTGSGGADHVHPFPFQQEAGGTEEGLVVVNEEASNGHFPSMSDPGPPGIEASRTSG